MAAGALSVWRHRLTTTIADMNLQPAKISDHSPGGRLATVNSSTSLKLSRQKPKDRKRTLGIFYTPKDLSRFLANWAILSASDSVLEPSFGGCGFLNESAGVLSERGAKTPWNQLCGCDKDARAFKFLPRRFTNIFDTRRFLHCDFLSTRPKDYAISQFDIVLGNPPYVSRHNMMKYQIRATENRKGILKLRISQRASLWAYFLEHSLNFLKEGGRMAWVLPRSLSQSDYGRDLLRSLSQYFEHLAVFSLQSRLFIDAGAEELVDVLLCSGFSVNQRESFDPSVVYVVTLSDLEKCLKAPLNSQRYRDDAAEFRQTRFSVIEQQAYEDFSRTVGARKLGDYATVRIGIVTGQTHFFVRTISELPGAGLSRNECDPILTKSRYVSGIDWGKTEVEDSIAKDHRVLLIRWDAKNTSSYWNTFPENQRATIATFKKRAVWNKPDDLHIPGAFFFTIVHCGPRAVLNTAETNCTNTLHRLYFSPAMDPLFKRSLLLLIQSSFTQLSGEIVGRVCGSGGLKFEPSDVLRLKIPDLVERLPHSVVDALWKGVDVFLRNNQPLEAMALVDQAIVDYSCGELDIGTVQKMQSAVARIRANRQRPAKL